MSRKTKRDDRQTSRRRDRQARRELPLRRKVLFAIVTVVAIFVLLEVGLRIARIGEPPTVGVLRFGYDTGIPVFDSDGIEREGETYRDLPLFEADPVLFWRPIANTPFTGPEGLRGDAPASKAKSPGVYRIAVVGDSCSFLGTELYPDRFAQLVQQQTEREVEVVNASCPGYTSFQGVRRLADVWDWNPDAIIVYFGWNDHWKSLNGQTDREVRQRQLLSEKAQSWLGESRLFWCLYSLRANLSPPVAINRAPVRVPLDHYRENLERMLREAEQRDCETIFVTAPSAYLDGQMPVWAFDFFGEIYRMSPEEVAGIPRLHARYNDIVRELARSNERALLLDVAERWSEERDKFPERFRGDRIHLTEAGHQAVAEQLYSLWKEALSGEGNR